MNKTKFFTMVFFVLGLFLFSFFAYLFGLEAIKLIVYNINYYYLSLFFFVSILAGFPLVWRLKMILYAYDIKIPFITLLRQAIAGFSISYTTPFMRVGGEPMRVYMLKKECGIDYKTGSGILILNEFMEIFGTILFGIVCLFLMLFMAEFSYNIKLFLICLILLGSSMLFIFYYRTITNKGTFSSLFNLLRLYKIKKWKEFSKTLEEIEEKMAYFFINHKKKLFLSLLFYCMSGILFVIGLKLALLSFGISTSIVEIVLAVTVVGLANLTPMPAGLGSLEGGQSGLFALLKGDGSIGMALTLLLRVGTLILIVAGFLIISQFMGKRLIKNE